MGVEPARGGASNVSTPADRCADASSASKALALLDAIAGSQKPVGVSEMALLMGMPKSTAHRLLKTLESHGLVGRVGAKYRLGERFLDFAEAARRSAYGSLNDAAVEPMTWLFERMGTIVQVGVLKGSDVMLLDKITGADGTRIRSRPGSRFAANGSALGKSLLAFSPPAVLAEAMRCLPRTTPYSIIDPRLLSHQLSEVRRCGFSFEREESQLGVRCVAAPIWRGDSVVAAISLCSTQPLNPPAHGRLVSEAAAQISRRLGP